MCLAFDQLRDVIESQEELIHQLRNVVRSRKSWGRGRTGSLNGGVGARPRPEAGACPEHIANSVIRRRRDPTVLWLLGVEPKGAGSHEYFTREF